MIRMARANFWPACRDGQSCDSAIECHVSRNPQLFPGFTAPFVNETKDDNQRYNTAQILAQSCFRNSPVAAEKWVSGLNLDSEKTAQLLKLKP
jgi:hypothetical protein